MDLFVARAAAAKCAFSLDSEDRSLVQELVTLLDGLPLAIELAAARVRVLPVKQILAHMTDRFRLLASGGGRKDRQATLRTAIDWSWDLLTPWEKAGLAQCSVFEGGFTFEAASAVLDLAEWPDAPWPMDVVQALVDKSLVRQVTDERFGLLVSIHEYAAEKLRTPGSTPGSGPEAEQAAWARHGGYFAEHGADEAVGALSRHGGVALRRALAADLDNFVAGCRRAAGRGDGAVAVALLRAAWEVLELQGPYPAGVALAEAVAGVPGLDDTQQAHAARVAGRASLLAGRPESAVAGLAAAVAGLAAAVAGFHRAGDRSGEARALHDLGWLWMEQGRIDEARQRLEAGLALARQAGALAAEAELLRNLGSVHYRQGRLDEAADLYQAALDLARAVGDRRTEGAALSGLAVVAYLRGRPDEAHARFAEAVAVQREVGNRRGEGVDLGNLGEMELKLGRLDEAWEHTEQALAIHCEVGDRLSEGYFLGNLGTLHHRAGRLSDARAAFQAGEAILRETRGRFDLAIQLGNKALVECDAGDFDAARVALAEAETIVAEMNAGPDSEPGQIVARVKARLAGLEGA